MKPAAVVVAAMIAFGGCSAPPERDDFAIPVPEGTREIEYEAVPVEGRAERLVLDRELVLPGAFDTPFYRPRAIAIAADGDIFVLDRGNHRVVVFDPDGKALRRFGRRGQGPGELEEPDAIGVAGDEVVVYQLRQRRISVFTAAGTHVADHTLEHRLWVGDVSGFEAQLIVVSPTRTPIPVRRGLEAPRVPWIVGVYAQDGTELRRIVETADTARGRFLTAQTAGLLPISAPHPEAALAPGGVVYVTAAREYEVLAADSSGNARWVLRADHLPARVTEAHRNAILAAVGENLPGETFEHVVWPERFAAIINVEADGDGNLYVFPYSLDAYFETDVQRDVPAGLVPVDVYSPEGERLFAGTIDIASWDAQHGKRICRIEPDPQSEEEVVACYRMVTSF